MIAIPPPKELDLLKRNAQLVSDIFMTFCFRQKSSSNSVFFGAIRIAFGNQQTVKSPLCISSPEDMVTPV